MKIDTVKGTLLGTNNYIVGENQSVIVEASVKLDSIKSSLKGRKVLAVFLTHGHWDHYLNLDKYLKEFECKVYMTEEAFKKINTKNKMFAVDRNPNIEISEKDAVFIKDGDVLKFNDMVFKVIETKGHTNCSVSFLLNDEFLFTGDTLFNSDVGRWDLPTGNYSELLQSLTKLFKLNDKIVVLPGHGEPTELGIEKKNKLI